LRRWLPDLDDLLLLLGAALVIVGVALVYIPAAIVLAGVLLCLIPLRRPPHGPAR
jgi:hypothetical protein